MDNRPDSALTLLESIPANQLANAGDKSRARYALLLTQARHKNYIDETNDSLIATAVHYYEKHSDPHRLMLACYYQGVVQSNALNYTPAIISLMKAESLAKEIKDYLFLGRISHNISKIYHAVHSPKDEVKYAKKSYYAFNNAADSLSIRHAEMNLVVALNGARNYDEAILLCDSILHQSELRKDTIFITKALSQLGYSYMRIERHKDAVDSYNRIRTLDERRMTKNDYYYLSTELWNLGERKECLYLIDSLREIYGNNTIIHLHILFTLGLKDEAYLNQKRISDDANVFIGEILSQNISYAISSFYDNEIEQRESELFKRRALTVCLFSITILITILCGYIIFSNRKLRKKKEEEILNLLQELGNLGRQYELIHGKLGQAHSELIGTQQELDSVQREFNSLTNKVTIDTYNTSLAKRNNFKSILLLCEYYDSETNSTSESQVAEEAMEIINDFASDENLNHDLETILNIEKNGIMKRFREQMPNLSEKEYTVFMLNSLRVSNLALQYIWKINRNTYYSIRRRIREKINDESPISKDEFLKLLK